MARESATRITIQDWRHLLTVGALVVGVLGTLVLGGRLQAEAAGEPHDLAVDATPVDDAAPSVPAPTTAQPEPATPAPSTAVTKPPATKASPPVVAPQHPRPTPTAARAATAGGDWTLQFMVTCQAETAERLENEIGSDARLHLLPVRLDGRDCVRICWGEFATREAAIAGSGVPAALRAVKADPMPRRISDLK